MKFSEQQPTENDMSHTIESFRFDWVVIHAIFLIKLIQWFRYNNHIDNYVEEIQGFVWNLLQLVDVQSLGDSHTNIQNTRSE